MTGTRISDENLSERFLHRPAVPKPVGACVVFPPLISAEHFQETASLRAAKAKQYGGSLSAEMKKIRQQICCGACGQTLKRINMRTGYILWECPECGATTDYLPDKLLLQNVTILLNRAIENRKQLTPDEKHCVCLDGTGAHVPADMTSLVLTQNATVEPDAGTSFTAPTVAGDLAEILSNTPNNDILLAKALLYHNAKPLWESDEMENEELAFAHNLYGRGIASVEDSKFSSPSRVTFLRTGSLNRLTKERVKIYMPEVLAAQVGRNVARVTVTCLTLPPVDRTKGSEYLGAFIRASLKKSHPDGRLLPVAQDYSEGRRKWDVCCQFTKTFTSFNSGDWQIWLELFSRWDEENLDVPYALVATIEDVSGTLDVYSEVQAQNRYQLANTLRIKVDA